MSDDDYKPGVVELDRRLDHPVSENPVFRYAIFSQQRSGSNWLRARLTNLGIFGVPGEYLNPRLIPQIVQRLPPPANLAASPTHVDLATYLRGVERIRTSPNGRFGIKIQPDQLFSLFKGDLAAATSFLRGYDALIVLTRQDKLRQAVSGAIAEVTDRWSPNGKEPDLSGVNMEKLLCDTAAKLARYIIEDRQIAAVSRSARRPMLTLTYERMVADPHGTLDETVRFLGHKQGLAMLPQFNSVKVPEPPPGVVSAEVRALFLDFIEGRVSLKSDGEMLPTA